MIIEDLNNKPLLKIHKELNVFEDMITNEGYTQ